jgi:hypothetical protein
MLRGLFEPVEIVRILAKVDEVSAGIVGVRPRDNENRIVGSTFD